jgi:O-acetyl-ADP-ribose deacetylase (regulator of RNase III)/transcriptional regulator with XRE-family HTH domain
MPLRIVKADIAEMKCDCIVNTANRKPIIGWGVDQRIHEAAGPELHRARLAIGSLDIGHAAITPGFGLKAKYVIHAVGPSWEMPESRQVLKKTYESCLVLASLLGARTIAIPLLCSGNLRFPKQIALQVANEAIGAFIHENDSMTVYLTVYDELSCFLSETLYGQVESFISLSRTQPQVKLACTSPHIPSTEDGFTRTLIRLINEKGMTNAQAYKKANVTKSTFSKILSNDDYRPTKSTAMAFCIALGLDESQSRDLLGRAGYSLSPSIRQDLIVLYCIQNKIRSIMEVNEMLFDFNEGQLGSVTK